MSPWLATREHPAADVHVMPLNDLIEHDESRSCQCGPTINDDGVVVHHSLDGREFSESNYEGPEMPKENVKL